MKIFSINVIGETNDTAALETAAKAFVDSLKTNHVIKFGNFVHRDAPAKTDLTKPIVSK